MTEACTGFAGVAFALVILTIAALALFLYADWRLVRRIERVRDEWDAATRRFWADIDSGRGLEGRES